MGMKLTQDTWLRDASKKTRRSAVVAVVMAIGLLAQMAIAQAINTTTVQGTVYLANGQTSTGTLRVSWPSFTTANGQSVTADSMTVAIDPDGFLSVNLAPNLGATPAGLYYTAVYYLSDGTTTTQYWVVPVAAQASLAQVQSQLMPSSQAVQAASKAYVDQAIAALGTGEFTFSGGTLTGPLYLNGDPTQSLQAADKHYVDTAVGQAVPLAGGNMTGALSTPSVNGVQAPAVGSSQTTLQTAISAAGTSGAMVIPPTYTGTDGFTNPNGVRVTDLRTTGAQQIERSVKEFGAVCDGVSDDTNALQTALNYAQTHGVALTIPQGTCKTRALTWHGESIGGMGKQVSALLGYPGQDVLVTTADSTNLLQRTRLHDLAIYVDQSVDVSCSAATGRASAGSCAKNRLLENNSIFSRGGNGLTGATGTGAGWALGNCAIAMPATTGAGGNGLRAAEIENVTIATTGVDPMAAQYPGAHSTHTCGMYLAQWPQWSEFRNIDINGVNTGIAIPALPVTVPAGLNADSNRWQNITMQTTHGFVAAVGSNSVLDNVVALVVNNAATGEPPTGVVLDPAGALLNAAQGWTVRNAMVLPTWNAVQPQLTVATASGAVSGVSVGTEHGLGLDPYGTQVPVKFSGSCTAAATASVNTDGSIGTVTVTQGGAGCTGTTTASLNVDGTWDTAAVVNLIGGQNMTFVGGNLLKGSGGYTVWNAAQSTSYGTQVNGGGGTLPGGGKYNALVANSGIGTAYQVDQFAGADFGAKLQACLNTVNATYGGSCDARNFTGNLSMGSNLTIATGNTTVQLPCATIATANQVIVTAGTRNVALRGCALRGGSAASGSQGGTVFAYSGTGAMVQVGDPTYAADTQGFHMDNLVINTTAATSATAQGLVAYRTQEMDLESLYFLGNQNQTGMTLDGTGNYTGGTFYDNALNGFQTAVNAIGHQATNSAVTDWMNASAFVRLHINCPTSGGNPIAGTYGINLQQGDGNTFTGGDVEGCATALHLGANAQNNTIIGLRNENSTSQVVADAGSAYNDWITGGTMFTGKLTDNGTRNSFQDTYHRSFNGMNGDWYMSQQDATVTNHFRIGTGLNNERGLLNRYQTDYGYRWTTGFTDATGGVQYYQVLDELNNVNRLSLGQYNHGQASTNNQTALNSAGTGAVILNGSTNAGTGGVVIGSGGASASAVATISSAGNAQFNGTLQVGGTSTFTGTTSVKNQTDAEIDQILWAGATTSQKEALTYKDWDGSSQWYLVKDKSNNWALNSATGGLDSFKAYQSVNSGDTYVNASNATGVVRVNYETGAGTGFKVYGGSSSSLYASFTGTTSIQFPGLAAGSGHYCLQIDNSGYLSNTGSPCGSGSGSAGVGIINSGSLGQIAYYTATGAVVGGTDTVPLTAGGTGSKSAAAALANLGGASVVNVLKYGAVGTGTLGSAGAGDAENTVAIQSAIDAALALGSELYFPCGVYNINQPLTVYGYQSIPVVGQGWGCTFLQYTGTTAVTQGMLTVAGAAPATNCTSVSCNHTTGMPPYEATGFQLENISMVGNSNVPDDLDLLLAAQFHLRDVALIGAGNASLYCQTCQQGQIDVPLLSYNVLWGLNSFLANQTPNGIILDGYSAPALDNAANHVHINSMNANLMTGKALWLRASTQNEITNCQLSSNAINIQIDAGGGDLFENCMSEFAGSGYGVGALNLSSNAKNETFVSSAVYGPVNIAGSLNRFIGGAMGTTTIAATAHNNLLDGVAVSSHASNITDNSPDTEYRPLYDISSSTVPANFPAWRRTTPTQQGSCSGILALAGSWNTSGSAVNLDPAPLCGLTPRWTALFSGFWTGQGGYEAVSTRYEFSSENSTLTLPLGGTATVSVSSGHLQLSAAGTGGTITFSGDIEFIPYSNRDSASFAGNLTATGLNSISSDSAVTITAATSGSRFVGFLQAAATDGIPADDALGISAYDMNSFNEVPFSFGGSQQITVNPMSNPDFPDVCPGCVGFGVDVPRYRVDADGDANITGSYRVGDAVVIPSTALGDHGSSGTYIQMSDGTGTSGNLTKFASDGSITNGPALPTGSIVGTTDTQTLTNKSIAGSEINSGTIPAAQLPAASSSSVGAVQLASGQSSSTLAKVATTGVYGDLSGTPTLPSGSVVGTTDAQTLTNKSIAGSEINSGTVGATYGGTGLNNASATGVQQWSSGTASVSTALASGTTGTTQSAGDNSTKLATTAYVASPGAISPTTVTASGMVTGGNDTMRTTSTTITTTSFTTTGLVLPTVPVSTAKTGRCLVYWQMSSTSSTATFGIGMSNAPTGLWGGTSVTYAAAGTSNWLAFTQTATAATAISTAATAGATATTYRAEVNFTVQTGATNPVALTVYGEVSNASATLTIQPGSACYWLP
jgi:hypothetical protein